MRANTSRPGSRNLVVGLSALVAAVLPPAPAAAHPVEDYQWVALGDSYTAGAFVGDPSPALSDPSRDGCDRTSGSYPYLVDQELTAFPPGRPVTLTNVSCGNATVTEIAGVGQRPLSPVAPPGDDPASWPQLAPQVVRAGLDDQTDVVTIGVGGNTLPMAELVATCLRAGLAGTSCREHYENPAEGVVGITDRYGRLQADYLAMLAEVHRVAPSAAVITVGYPAILPEDTTTCAPGDLTELATVSQDDLDWLRDVLANVNRIIRQVSSFFGDHYVDVHTSSVGHDACQPEDTRWVEGVCGEAADFWPTTLDLPDPPIRLDCAAVDAHATVLHPNQAGHINTATHVERAIRIALLER